MNIKWFGQPLLLVSGGKSMLVSEGIGNSLDFFRYE